MQINDLPLELKWKILTFASLKEIFFLLKLSKSWQTIDNNDNFWKEIYNRYPKSIMELKIHRKYVQKNSLKKYQFEEDDLSESEKYFSFSSTYKRKVASLWRFFVNFFFSNENWWNNPSQHDSKRVKEYFPFFKKPKVVLIGRHNSGKSSLTKRFVRNEYYEYQESGMMAAFQTQTIPIENERIEIQLWDTAGQERYMNAMPRMFFRNAHGALLCFSITDRKSFEDLDKWYNNILEGAQIACQIVCVGCKSDLEKERTVKKEEIEKFCKERKLKYFECSSKIEKGNVVDIFVYIAKKCHLIGNFFENEISPYFKIVEGKLVTREEFKEKTKINSAKKDDVKKKCNIM